MVDTLQITYFGYSQLDEMTQVMNICFARALARSSSISIETLSIRGMSGQCYRMFINNLVRMTAEARYLEVGSWAGSTACSALDKNVLTITCIDNWSEFGGPKDEFYKNVKATRTMAQGLRFIECDFRKVDVPSIGKFNIYLFDGPHKEEDQFDGLNIFRNALDDQIYFIVDDWNWGHVRRATKAAIKATGFRIDYAIEVRTTLNDQHPITHSENSDWHNGYFLSKLARI